MQELCVSIQEFCKINGRVLAGMKIFGRVAAFINFVLACRSFAKSFQGVGWHEGAGAACRNFGLACRSFAKEFAGCWLV